MVVQCNTNEIIDLIRINQLKGFEICNQNDSKSYVFKSNPDNSIEQNIKDFTNVMQLVSGSYFTFYGWLTDGKNKTLITYIFENNLKKNEGDVLAGTMPVHMPMTTTGITGNAITEEEIERRISVAVAGVRQEYKEEALRKFEQQLLQDKKEFEAQKNSGLDFILARVGSLFGKFPELKVAGLENQSTIPAVKQLMKGTEDTASDTDIASEKEMAEDTINDRVSELLTQWSETDGDFLAVLEKIVEFATSGKEVSIGFGASLGYNQVKKMLLELHL